MDVCVRWGNRNRLCVHWCGGCVGRVCCNVCEFECVSCVFVSVLCACGVVRCVCMCGCVLREEREICVYNNNNNNNNTKNR